MVVLSSEGGNPVTKSNKMSDQRWSGTRGGRRRKVGVRRPCSKHRTGGNIFFNYFFSMDGYQKPYLTNSLLYSKVAGQEGGMGTVYDLSTMRSRNKQSVRGTDLKLSDPFLIAPRDSPYHAHCKSWENSKCLSFEPNKRSFSSLDKLVIVMPTKIFIFYKTQKSKSGLLT